MLLYSYPEDMAGRLALAQELAHRPRAGVSADRLALALINASLVRLSWGDRAAAEALWQELAPLAERSPNAMTLLLPISAEFLRGTLDGHLEAAVEASEQLGAAAVLPADQIAARAYTEQALAVAGKVQNRPELALSRLQLAELLAEGTPAERTEGMAHLGVAISELEAMHMQPALVRALALRDRLGAAQAGGAAGTGTVMGQGWKARMLPSLAENQSFSGSNAVVSNASICARSSDSRSAIENPAVSCSPVAARERTRCSMPRCTIGSRFESSYNCRPKSLMSASVSGRWVYSAVMRRLLDIRYHAPAGVNAPSRAYPTARGPSVASATWRRTRGNGQW
jgi:hypothetical protein